jgi:hypothetical protein
VHDEHSSAISGEDNMSLERPWYVMYLQYLGSQGPRSIAVLALDRENDHLCMRFTTEWSGIDEVSLDALSSLSVALAEKAYHFGGNALLCLLNSLLPNKICLTDARRIFVTDVDAELLRLEQEVLTHPVIKHEPLPPVFSNAAGLTTVTPSRTGIRAPLITGIAARKFAYIAATAVIVLVGAAGWYVSDSVACVSPPRSSFQLSTPRISLPRSSTVSVAQNSNTRRRRPKSFRRRMMRANAHVVNTFTPPPERTPHFPEPVITPPPRLTVATVGHFDLAEWHNDDEAVMMTFAPPRRSHLVVRILRTLSMPFRAITD